MTATGHSVQIETLVALSLLRLGSDTRAQRAFRETVAAELEAGAVDATDVMQRLALLAGLPPIGSAEQIAHAQQRAARALKSAEASGYSVLSFFDADYPPWLACIPDPPIVLWIRGTREIGAPAVAIVGSRRATSGGQAVARRLGRELAERGLVVVSGFARGIDAAAHAGALEANGRTLAVLGNGLDVSYPRDHGPLGAAIARSGAVISEYPCGTQPYASHFPLRNRIISGLAMAVVVVEASERSGSLLTARAALEQGRGVLAVPGNVASGHHKGSHALIKDGARLVETVDDVLEEIGWVSPSASKSGLADKLRSVNDLDGIVAIGESVGLDDLAARTGRTAAEWLATLTELELAGKVARTPGGAFIRLDASVTN